MAIVWGPYQNHMRIGIDIVQVPSSVGQSTTSVRLDFAVWIQMDGSSSQYINNGVLYFSGKWGTSSKTIPINLGPGQQARVHTTSGTYATIVGQSQTFTFGVSVSHWFGSTGYPARSWTIPARPAAPPATPGTPGRPTVSRSSDTRHTITWTRPGTSATSVTVQRRENGGSWKQVGKPSGNASSFTDTSTAANRKYEYRVRRTNAGGSSNWSRVSVAVYTTPAKTGEVSATRVGSDIRVSVASLPPHATHFDIEDNGTVVATAVPRASLPWTHTSPSLVTVHRYRVRPRVASGGSNSTTLYGAWSAWSATVQLTAPPNAPSGLSPNGIAWDAATQISVFRWRHNPTDSSEQTEYQIRHRAVGSTSWAERAAVQSATENAGILSPAASFGGTGVYEWQVRTKGVHPNWSPWSATATIEFLDAPQVSIEAPGAIADRPDIRVEWDYFQGQGRGQSRFEVQLLDSNGVVVETRYGTSAKSLLLNTRVADGTQWTVRVRVASTGIWSTWAEHEFDVQFVAPAPPVVSGHWDEETGSVQLAIGEGERYNGPDITNYFTNPNLVGDGTYAEVRRNLARNPSFESGTTYWAAYSGAVIVRATTEAHSGGAAGSVTFGNSGTSGIYTSVSSLTPETQYTASMWVKAPAGTTFTFELEERTASASIDAVVITGTGNGQWERYTASKPFGSTGTDARIIVRGSESKTLYIDAVQLEVGNTATTYFDGSSIDATMPQPEDFHVRWLGTPNESESVMEIERVAGLVTTSATIAGVSSRGGRPAIRLIPTGPLTVTYTRFDIPSGPVTAGGVLMGTLHLDAPLTGNLWGSSRRLYIGKPDQFTSTPPNTAGAYPSRVEFSELTTPYQAFFPHGGAAGSGDVWWTDIGLFAGDYDGPLFSGDDSMIDLGDGRWKGVKWDGEPNNSTSSTFTLPDTVEAALYRSIDGGETWELVAEGLAPSDNVTDWESLSNGYTMYRAIAYTAIGASSYSDVSIFADSDRVWLGGGAGFELSAGLCTPTVSISKNRERALQHFQGRSLGVVYSGSAVTRAVSARGFFVDEDVPLVEQVNELLQDIISDPYPLHVYRDLDGRRIYGMLTQLPLVRETALSCGRVAYSWSFSLEEGDRYGA